MKIKLLVFRCKLIITPINAANERMSVSDILGIPSSTDSVSPEPPYTPCSSMSPEHPPTMCSSGVSGIDTDDCQSYKRPCKSSPMSYISHLLNFYVDVVGGVAVVGDVQEYVEVVWWVFRAVPDYLLILNWKKQESNAYVLIPGHHLALHKAIGLPILLWIFFLGFLWPMCGTCLLRRWFATYSCQTLDGYWSTYEMKAFVGVLILMGICKLPRLDLYWSTNHTLPDLSCLKCSVEIAFKKSFVSCIYATLMIRSRIVKIRDLITYSRLGSF